MHQSAQKNALLFLHHYCKDLSSKRVLDVGSMNVNGCLKPIFIDAKEYIGLDQSEGRNVDIVGSSHDIPFEDSCFDIVVSSSCFEHDDMFWVTFLEMCRVLKQGGFIYTMAPSCGPYHAYPVDNWRFYKDSWNALKKWAIKNEHDIDLVDSYVDEGTHWGDSVGIFKKS